MRNVWADRIAGIVMVGYFCGTVNAVAQEHHSAFVAGLIMAPAFIAGTRLVP